MTLGARAELQTTTASLRSSNRELSPKIDSLTKIIDEQTDQLNRLRIPEVVKKKLGVSDLLVDYMAKPLIDGIKSRAVGLAPAVDAASGVIKLVVRAKLSSPSVRLAEATRISGSVYNTNLILSVPVRLSEFPVFSALQNVIGDITFNVNVNLTAEVDVAKEIATNVQFVGVGLG